MGQWTAEQKAKALDIASKSGVNEAARLTGVPSGTIKAWRNRTRATATTPGPAAATNVVPQSAASTNAQKSPQPDAAPVLRDDKGRWLPGASPRPGGKSSAAVEAVRLAEAFAPEAIELLIEIARNPKAGGKVRVEAITQLLDRALGKPKQQVDITHDIMRAEAKRLAEELGLDEEDLLREAEGILTARRDG